MELCALVIFSAQTLHLQDIFLLRGRLHTASCQSKLSQVRTHSAPVCGPHDAPQTRHAAVELIATSDEAQVGLFHVQQGRAGIHQQGHFLQLWADLDQRIRGHLKAEMLGLGRPALILHTCTAAHELQGQCVPRWGMNVIASRACGTERSERATEDPTPAVFVPFSSTWGSAGVESGAASANACDRIGWHFPKKH